MIVVKQCKVLGVPSFGITDGKKWFFYAYPSEDVAVRVACKITPDKVATNISYYEPGLIWAGDVL